MRHSGVEQLTKPVELYKADIHATKGFGCVACHGGDGTKMGLEAMDRAKGYIGKPTPTQVIEVCGRCHSDPRFMRQYNPSLRVDQVAEYYTSVHGRRLKELKDPKVATCASCHIPHSDKAAQRCTLVRLSAARCGYLRLMSCKRGIHGALQDSHRSTREVQEKRSLEDDDE